VRDPGVRSGPPTEISILSGLTGAERALFRQGFEAFQAVNAVEGERAIPGTEGGLGLSFNLDSCAGCHAFPTAGGSSPKVNPQIAVAKKAGAKNEIPWFVRPNGPAVQVRIKWRTNGERDGAVLGLFTISGRLDAGACDLNQPNFAQAGKKNNLS